MYWAVTQICMAKHLRSRGWWGGWFTGQGENVHNGWLSLRRCRFAYTLVQLLPGLIDHRTFLSPAPEPVVFCSLQRRPRDPLLPFLLLRSSCPRFTDRALQKKFRGDILRRARRWGGGRCSVWGKNCRGARLRGRTFAGSHTLGIIRIYVCPSIPPHPRLILVPAVDPSVVRRFTGAWLIPECVWSEWITPLRFIMALYFSSLSSSLVQLSTGNEMCKTGYIFYCMDAVTHAQLGIRSRRRWFSPASCSVLFTEQFSFSS